MTESDLKAVISDGLQSGKTAFELHHSLREFAADGGTRNAADRMLNEIRIAGAADEAMEDTVLELLDFVAGSCAPMMRVW